MSSTELLVFVFQEEASAGVALAELREWAVEGSVEIVEAAILVRDDEGEVNVKETADPEPGKGALAGAAAGALIGLLAGPAGVVVGAAAGAGAGALAAHQIDLGIANEALAEMATELRPGTSAILVLVEHPWTGQVAGRLEQYGARAVRQELKEEIVVQLGIQDSLAPLPPAGELRQEPDARRD